MIYPPPSEIAREDLPLKSPRTIYPPLKLSNFEQNFKRTQHHALLHKGLFCERPKTWKPHSFNLFDCAEEDPWFPGGQPIFRPKFPENRMKIRKIWLRCGCVKLLTLQVFILRFLLASTHYLLASYSNPSLWKCCVLSFQLQRWRLIPHRTRSSRIQTRRVQDRRPLGTRATLGRPSPSTRRWTLRPRLNIPWWSPNQAYRM